MRNLAPWAFWIGIIAIISMGLSMFSPSTRQVQHFWAYVWTLDGVALAIWGARRFFFNKGSKRV